MASEEAKAAAEQAWARQESRCRWTHGDGGGRCLGIAGHDGPHSAFVPRGVFAEPDPGPAPAAAEQAWAAVAGEAKAASDRAWAVVGGATGRQRCQRKLGGWRVGASILEMQCVRAAGHDGLCSPARTCMRDAGAGLECVLAPGHKGDCVAGEAFADPGAVSPPDPLTLARAAVERASEWRAASFGGEDYAAAMKAEQGAIALLARVEADVEKRAGVRASREWRDMERVVLEEVGALGEAGRAVSERIAARLRGDGGEVRR